MFVEKFNAQPIISERIVRLRVCQHDSGHVLNVAALVLFVG